MRHSVGRSAFIWGRGADLVEELTGMARVDIEIS